MKKHPKSTFLDVPKNSLIFTILVVLFTCNALFKNVPLYAIIPFVWLAVVILIQSIFALKYRLIRGKWNDIGYIYISFLFELLFEAGTFLESIKNRDPKFLFRRFIYIEDQLLRRWYWGIIKMWSFVASLFALLFLLLVR
jgi:hypothetical protein